MHRLIGILGMAVLLTACSSDDEERATSSISGSNSLEDQSQVLAPVQEPEPMEQVVEQEEGVEQSELEAEVNAGMGSPVEPKVQDELEQANQMLESARVENDELAARIQKLEATFKEQELNMERQDEMLNDLKKQLESQTQE